MGYPKIEEIALAAKEWDFIKNLPDNLGPFTKKIEGNIEGQELHICSFTAPTLKAKVDIIYTAETFDYILVRSLGLNIYRDVSLIYKEKDLFAQKVLANLPHILHSMEHPEDENLGEMVIQKKILTWDYGNNLPKSIGPFELYITPQKSIEHINGSIIIIDYTDFTHGDQFLVYYNRLRDEFFGEVKVGSVFHATKDFDAKSLTALQQKLETNLEKTLTGITAADHEL